MADDFERWELPTKHIGRHVRVHDRLDSTNTLALSFAGDPTQNGLVLLARTQTAGRGQYGRTWQAPPESSVLLSALLFPPASLHRPALLTAWAAVAVCETILKIASLQTQIKWPNDVLIDGKKVCGILIEQRTTGLADFPLAAVAGIGLNVTQSAALFQDAMLPDAASLASLSGQKFRHEVVANELIRELDQQYQRLLDGDLETLESMWKRRLGLLGKVVIAKSVQRDYRGRLADISFSGIELQMEGSELVRLAPELIRNLSAE